MWKRSWIERRNGQADWLNGRAERISRRKIRADQQKENQSGLAEGKLERISRRKKRTEKKSGLAEGERSNKLKIAKTLIAKGFEKEEIAEITELSIEEIEKMSKDK